MSMPDVKEKWQGKIGTVVIGATSADGGTRGKAVRIGGHTTIHFLGFEGQTTPPATAFEVPGVPPEAGEWPEALIEPWRDLLKSMPVICVVGAESWKSKEARAR